MHFLSKCNNNILSSIIHSTNTKINIRVNSHLFTHYLKSSFCAIRVLNAFHRTFPTMENYTDNLLYKTYVKIINP